MITLVLGGARSGKSDLAERLATAAAADAPTGGPSVRYIATGVLDGSDTGFAERVARHRARRSPEWATTELALGGDLAAELGRSDQPAAPVVLVDSLGTWLAGFDGFAPDVDALVEALAARAVAGLTTVLVSDEVGLGVYPASAEAVRYCDALGQLNRRVAEVAAEVVLTVAGRAIRLPPPDGDLWPAAGRAAGSPAPGESA